MVARESAGGRFPCTNVPRRRCRTIRPSCSSAPNASRIVLRLTRKRQHQLHLRRELLLRAPISGFDLGTQHPLDLMMQRDRRMIRGSWARCHYVPALVQKTFRLSSPVLVSNTCIDKPSRRRGSITRDPIARGPTCRVFSTLHSGAPNRRLHDGAVDHDRDAVQEDAAVTHGNVEVTARLPPRRVVRTRRE
jgi:hypothetical protein